MVGEHAAWLALFIALGFALRLLWILVSDWQPITEGDAWRYDFAARALAEGRGYIHVNGAPTAFWPPGYPLLLAGTYTLFDGSLLAAQMLNVLFGAGTVILVYAIGRRTIGAKAALAGAAIVALFPSLIFYTAVTLSELAFTFLALLGVYLLIIEAQRGRRDLTLLLAAGVVLGFAALVRGQALLLPLVMVPFWLRSGIAWPAVSHRLVALALGMGLIIAPWTVRNAIELDSPVLISTNAGVNFWIGHNEEAASKVTVSSGDDLIYRHPELTTVEREVRVSNEGFREGVEYALTHPAQETLLAGKKLFWLYYNDEEALAWNEGHGAQPFLSDAGRLVLLSISNVYYFAVLALMALGAWRWFSLRHAGVVLLLSLVAYWTLVHVAFFSNPRFHAPIMPIVALLAGLSWAALNSDGLPWKRGAEAPQIEAQ